MTSHSVGLLDFIFRPKKISLRQAYEDAASEIEAFVEGRGGEWDWDDFTSTSKPDAFLESVRNRCDAVYDEFPATQKGRYCSDEGFDVLRSLARDVRERLKSIPEENA